jgi:hypothetical protein
MGQDKEGGQENNRTVLDGCFCKGNHSENPGYTVATKFEIIIFHHFQMIGRLPKPISFMPQYAGA